MKASEKIVQAIIKKGLKNVPFEKTLNLFYSVEKEISYIIVDRSTEHEKIDYKVSDYFVKLIQTHLGNGSQLKYLELSIEKDVSTNVNLYFTINNKQCKKTLSL